jgi:tetratricopeptide (TPR) repeat protein
MLHKVALNLAQEEIFLFSALLFCSNVAQACYNEYSIQNGELQDVAHYQIISGMKSSSIEHALYLARDRHTQNPTTENYSDFGVALCYAGRYAEAMKIFQAIEKKTPNKYQTAANIGTTYELLGKLDSALFWIKRGLQINPDSHGGSEWIHVKILEHEIAANGDANYSLTHSVLGWDSGNDSIPTKMKNKQWIEHLGHQLTERMVFVKPKNTVVGQLIFEYANINAMWGDKLNIDVWILIDIYEKAMEYGYNTPLIEKRLAYLGVKPEKTIVENRTETTNYNFYYLIPALLSALAFCGIVCWKR